MFVESSSFLNVIICQVYSDKIVLKGAFCKYLKVTSHTTWKMKSEQKNFKIMLSFLSMATTPIV